MASADFTIEITGVMPLPPLKSISSRAPSSSTKRPAGGVTIRHSPAATWSLIQFEMRPSAIRLTVNLCSASQCGELASE